MTGKIGVLSIMTVLTIAVGALLIVSLSGCGGGGSCDGTTFVNESGETVTVSASSTSGIQFSTFTLAPGDSRKVCGDDVNGIGGDYEWPDGDTAQLGLTWSGGNFCIYLLSNHTAESGNCP